MAQSMAGLKKNTTPAKNGKEQKGVMLQHSSLKQSRAALEADQSKQLKDLGSCLEIMYADLSLSNASRVEKIITADIMGGYGILANLGGEILSNFRYETSMNQSKILLTNSQLSSLSSQLSSIKSRYSNESKLKIKQKQTLISKKNFKN